MRQLIREQMQQQVQEKIKQLVNDSLSCFSGSVKLKHGMMHIRNMEFILRDIKIEPGELSVALRYVEGTYIATWNNLKGFERTLMDPESHIVIRRWFEHALHKVIYYNIKQITINITDGEKTVVIKIPPPKPFTG